MSWTCKCGIRAANVVLKCVKCRTPRFDFEPFDEWDEIISERRFHKLDKLINAGGEMNAQEELFATLFNSEKVLVKDMDILTLRAHREQLAQIAFEARARLTAVDDEEKGRRKKSDGNKPTGFQRNLNIDDATSDAINTIKDRQKKLTKDEKLYQSMLSIMSPEAAAKAMAARTIVDKLKENKSLTPAKKESQYIAPASDKKIFNPFEKK